MSKKQPSLTVDLSELVTLFELPEIDEMTEANEDFFYDNALAAYASKNGYSIGSNGWGLFQDCPDCDHDLDFCETCGGDGKVEIENWRDTDFFESFLDKERESYFQQYKHAVESAVSATLEHYGLMLKKCKIRIKADSGKSYVMDGYRIQPKPGPTWKKAAARLIEVINGYSGHFFDSALDLLHIGPYKSYKEAIAHHRKYFDVYGQVYGDQNTRTMFYSSMS